MSSLCVHNEERGHAGWHEVDDHTRCWIRKCFNRYQRCLGNNLRVRAECGEEQHPVFRYRANTRGTPPVVLRLRWQKYRVPRIVNRAGSKQLYMANIDRDLSRLPRSHHLASNMTNEISIMPSSKTWLNPIRAMLLNKLGCLVCIRMCESLNLPTTSDIHR